MNKAQLKNQIVDLLKSQNEIEKMIIFGSCSNSRVKIFPTFP